MSTYGGRPIKRRSRRSKAEIEGIRTALYETLAADHPQTVRQVFYAMTVQGVIPKTEREYKGTVCRLLAEMRRSRELPYEWLADATRWMRRPETFSSVESALARTAETYRRALWEDTPVSVEVWCEKEALAGVLVDATWEWDVALMVTKGYPSMTFLYSAAAGIKARYQRGQRTHIYYFGDRDPSGVDIDRAVQEGLRNSMVGSRGTFDAFQFERVAVTEEQVGAWDLPTRPTKRSDTRSKNFKGESVELDAIPPDRLRWLALDAIERHVDQDQLSVLRTVEAEERRGLERIAGIGRAA